MPSQEILKNKKFTTFVIVQLIIAMIAVIFTIVITLNISPLIHKKANLEIDVKKQQESIAKLKEEVLAIEQMKIQLEKDVNKLSNIANKQQQKSSPDIVKLIVPKAKAEQLSNKADSQNRPVYKFSAWLDVPKDKASEIKEVTYEFDHPSFGSEKFERSTDPSSGFMVNYNGWGALSLVTIKIKLRNGTINPIYFNMYEAVWGKK